jgi:geranylgeranyl diphosphate synthase, type II
MAMTEQVPSSAEKSPMDSFARVALQILDPYRKRFDLCFQTALPALGDDSSVRQAMAYSLQSGGKRLRPAIVWMVSEALHSFHSVDLAALAVEFFHVSSLITDDLPCMDNDDFRRGVATTHKAFSEATAILASFALTSAGFELISRIPFFGNQQAEVLRAAYYVASRAIGLQGLIGGQQYDLKPKGFDEESINTIIDLKTGALFGVSFVLGWLFSGGVVEKVGDLQQLAAHFGRAFQILDDLDDIEQDKEAGKQINYALLFGVDAAQQQVRLHVEKFCALATELGLGESPLVTLASAMRLVVG